MTRIVSRRELKGKFYNLPMQLSNVEIFSKDILFSDPFAFSQGIFLFKCISLEKKKIPIRIKCSYNK